MAVAHPGKVARHHPRGGASCGDEGAAHPAGGPDAPAEQRLAKERPLLAALPSLQLRIGRVPESIMACTSRSMAARVAV